MRELFFPTQPHSASRIRTGRRRIIEEGAVAAVIYSVATGNIMVGYLSYLGFSIAACAAIAMIPQLGCVLQFFSPFLFERLQYRKFSIWIFCGIFRFFASLAFLLPLLELRDGYCAVLVVVFYSISFLAAGFVTPGLQLLVLAASPEEGRGTFFARKDIISVVFNSTVILLLSR
ncbi:MAG: MFS transporter, partial [Lachnospiraceae bacterium]|nr:MFS transporter [Lachnospiraceae bacterium]